jgi:hypothetical protein
MTARLDAALEYARRGWPVFPLHTPINGDCSCGNSKYGKTTGKHPRTLNGLKDAATSEAVIREWWCRWPDNNIGLATGRESGIVMLGVDPRHVADEGQRHNRGGFQ